MYAGFLVLVLVLLALDLGVFHRTAHVAIMALVAPGRRCAAAASRLHGVTEAYRAPR